MTVHFIGAGPGAPDLLTLRGRDLIAASPVCLYAGSLIPEEMLRHCPQGARIINTASMSLDGIMAEIAAAHAQALDVARLHSGDLSVWSAMGEQLRRLRELGIPYDITPGVPSFAAGAAAQGGADVGRQGLDRGLLVGDEQRARFLDGDVHRLLRVRIVGVRHRRRQVQADRHGRQRRGHHEDDQQHQHHVHEGRDVDFRVLLDGLAAVAAGSTQLRAHVRLRYWPDRVRRVLSPDGPDGFLASRSALVKRFRTFAGSEAAINRRDAAVQPFASLRKRSIRAGSSLKAPVKRVVTVETCR